MMNEFENKETLEKALSQTILDSLQQAIDDKGYASLLFSGGSTPKALMNRLATSAFNWRRVRIGLVDDRMVDKHSTYSNASMLEVEFINRILPNRQPDFYPLVFEVKNLQKNMQLARYSLEKLRTIDVVLLGMGQDGHFASLFPNDAASDEGLKENYEPSILYTNAPAYPTHRISLSWSFIRQAKHLYLHITGSSKKDLLNQNQSTELPIDVLLNNNNQNLSVYWAP